MQSANFYYIGTVLLLLMYARLSHWGNASFFIVCRQHRVTECFGDVLRGLIRIFHWCEAVPVQDVLNSVTLAYMTHSEIDCIILRRVSKLFCASLSYSFLDFVVSSLERCVWYESDLSLCEFL